MYGVVIDQTKAGDHGTVVSGNTIQTRFLRANFLALQYDCVPPWKLKLMNSASASAATRWP